MGDCASSQVDRENNIVVGSLNFSGICLSPFEYHDSSVEKDFMSSKFQEVMKKYFKDQKFAWDVGKIDQKLQEKRYAPVYNKLAGVENGKLLTREKFEQIWKIKFDESKKDIEKEPTQTQIKQALDFDWICYETFLNVVYNQTPKQRFDLATIESRKPKLYLEFLEHWHSKTYLSNEKKMKRVAEVMKDKNLDVLCLQQANVKCKRTWSQVVGQQYQVIERKGTDSVIIVSRKKFPKSSGDDSFSKKYEQKLNFNDDSIIVKRGNYLLISGHLSSKQQRYSKQTPDMFKALQEVLEENKGLHIILGIDCNHFMNPKNFPSFNITPKVQTEATSIKKRTAIQLQTKKTNVIVMETKDQIVSDLKISSSQVTMINGQATSDKTYLPCEDHPFDHFLVSAFILVNQKGNQESGRVKAK